MRRILAANASFMAILRALRAAALPQGCVGAGAVRSLVWDALHGRSQWTMRGDVDVAYFDGTDLSVASQSAYLARLRRIEPDAPWEVVNQAGVHLWYERHFGFAVAPLSSVEEAIATWPEYASCVAVRLEANGWLDIVAPWGLDDLFSMTVRHNPTRARLDQYHRRIHAKRYAEQWPNVTVVV
ncbi:nucleotidyltransferase family protein [Bordetella sp. FB-8]|uniref:nucleotidyltransferase family protein n=1 Tax=Bordetella sp. FB-8 TaxID=1159870 RepID=UPI0003A0BB2E|nr:nucleotidyltransferase family protein [Bordetella sp. FB-8]